jgi:hypothetical protein
MTSVSEGDQLPHDDAPAARWVHKDGSLCPSWEECDTYEHTTLDGNETIQRIKARPFDHEGQGNIDQVIAEAEAQRDGVVGELIDGRVDVYGDPAAVFPRHAQAWSAILGFEVQPWQVALCMMQYKLIRTAITPDYSDNSDDIDGYKDIFNTLIGDEMIHARDTKSYVEKGGKGRRT